jgi:hypothetical protein
MPSNISFSQLTRIMTKNDKDSESEEEEESDDEDSKSEESDEDSKREESEDESDEVYKREEEKRATAPIPRKISGFNLFQKENVQKVREEVEKSNDDSISRIAQYSNIYKRLWEDLSDEQRDTYKKTEILNEK